MNCPLTKHQLVKIGLFVHNLFEKNIRLETRSIYDLGPPPREPQQRGHLVGVAILFEILKAFTIETFLTLKEEEIEQETGEPDEEEKVVMNKKQEEVVKKITEKEEHDQLNVIKNIQTQLKTTDERLILIIV